MGNIEISSLMRPRNKDERCDIKFIQISWNGCKEALDLLIFVVFYRTCIVIAINVGSVRWYTKYQIFVCLQ